MALFSGLVFNTSETILEGRLTTKGRIEYQFLTYGGVTVVFIEVKLEIGGSTERLNCVAQVIAECDGMVQNAPNLDRYRLTFCSLCLGEPSKRIRRTDYGSIMRRQNFQFLQICQPTLCKRVSTDFLGRIS